jgi:hypothetical protein
MTAHGKLLQRILVGTSDNNIEFNALCGLLKRLGFRRRVKGDHYIFWKDEVEEILNLQPRGSKAKSYQVKQIRDILLKYKLGGSREAQG